MTKYGRLWLVLLVTLGELPVHDKLGARFGHGQWLVNVVVASVSTLATAVFVVGLSIIVDRYDSPGIRIVGQPGSEAIIQISGAVATPGVYEIPTNGRLVDALAAAGGLTDEADTTQLNLAARVGDGEHVHIRIFSTPSEQIDEVDANVSARINVNLASAAELDLLPGIGPVIAGRIIDEREENGAFVSVDSLTRVTGISAGTLEGLRPLVTVGD